MLLHSAMQMTEIIELPNVTRSVTDSSNHVDILALGMLYHLPNGLVIVLNFSTVCALRFVLRVM
jgi:hypothetical protein